MSNDINIPVKVTGAQQAQEQIRKTGKAAKGASQQNEEAQKKAGNATEQTTQKTTGLQRAFGGLKSQAISLIAGFMGFQSVIKLFETWIAKFERANSLLKEMHNQNMPLQELAQAMELQTGTVGQTDMWSKMIVDVQRAGKMASPEQAKAMMTSVDVVYGLDKGHNKENVQLTKDLGAMVTAAGMSANVADSYVKYAAAAGIGNTKADHEAFLGKITAGQATSASTSMSQYMSGLITGTISLLNQGGTLKESIALYNQNIAVESSEAEAATATKRLGSATGGGMEKVNKAIANFLGKDFKDLTTDERIQGAIDLAASIPQSERQQKLTNLGFEGKELLGTLSKLSSPESFKIESKSIEAVQNATADKTREFTDAYKKSRLAIHRETEAIDLLNSTTVTKENAFAIEMIERAKNKHKAQAAVFEDDKNIPDNIEPYYMLAEIAKKNARKILSDDEATLEQQMEALEVSQLASGITSQSNVWGAGLKSRKSVDGSYRDIINISNYGDNYLVGPGNIEPKGLIDD